MMVEEMMPIEDLLASGAHIGVKFRTKFMEPYVYKIRPDGLSVLDTEKILEQIKNAARLLSEYEPEEILVVSRRESGWKPVKMFAKAIGARKKIDRYVPGSITNPEYEKFFEPKIIILTDPWTDRNALKDAVKTSIPVISLCDSNNTTRNVDLCIPCNNKGKKSLAMIYWLLAREFLKQKEVIKDYDEFKPAVDDFTQKVKKE